MTAAIVAILMLVAVAYVVAPLLKKETDTFAPSDEGFEAREEKRRALEAILDLENDLESGKITADEHDVLRAEHERDALDSMRELDVLEVTASDTAIENAIAAERERITWRGGRGT